EFVWALTATFACFAVILLPAFAIYAVSRRRERADEAKLAEAEAMDSTSTPEADSDTIGVQDAT
ncbi:MAG TPA: hypothetical protein HA276_02365, partial [Candidatus Poseidoniaceae archaeon]